MNHHLSIKHHRGGKKWLTIASPELDTTVSYHDNCVVWTARLKTIEVKLVNPKFGGWKYLDKFVGQRWHQPISVPEFRVAETVSGRQNLSVFFNVVRHKFVMMAVLMSIEIKRTAWKISLKNQKVCCWELLLGLGAFFSTFRSKIMAIQISRKHLWQHMLKKKSWFRKSAAYRTLKRTPEPNILHHKICRGGHQSSTCISQPKKTWCTEDSKFGLNQLARCDIQVSISSWLYGSELNRTF